MCGIAGYIDFSASPKDAIKAMTGSMAHRGPDGEGLETVQCDNAVLAFGHKRLSIIDLSETGKQPMRHKHLLITFNGEVYNFNDIKSELKALKHQFSGHSDTEVILHAYEEWGQKCLEKFIGMFAFAIYDAKQHSVFFARDRAGIKPFYYYHDEERFLFASELKAFHQHPDFKKSINQNVLAMYMQYGNVPAPYCIFENCYKLIPGHFMVLHLATKKIETQKYWNVYDNAYNTEKVDIGFAEAKSKTEALLVSAFNYRMIADVPVGVFLSGGYDSVCLTALLQKNSSEKIKTFTIGVSDFGLDESVYAKEIAKILGTAHNTYYCNQKEALGIIEELPYYYDEPFGDSSAVPTTLVCKIAKQQVTVALSADGGDEVFAGYNRYDYLMKHGKLLNNTPKLMRDAAAFLMHRVSSQHLPVLKNRYNFHNRYNKLKNLLSDPSPESMMKSLSTQFLDEELKKLMLKPFQHLESNYQSNALKTDHYSPLRYMMAVDYETYLPDDILQKVDRASMSASLEAREPFLDHRIIEWAAKLPDHFKYKDGIKKYMLKEIVHQYVPKQMMDRPKMGFAIPVEEWLYTELKPMVLKYLDDVYIEKQALFNVTYVNQLKNTFYKGKPEHAVKIWFLLMFQMWYEKWMGEKC